VRALLGAPPPVEEVRGAFEGDRPRRRGRPSSRSDEPRQSRRRKSDLFPKEYRLPKRELGRLSEERAADAFPSKKDIRQFQRSLMKAVRKGNLPALKIFYELAIKGGASSPAEDEAEKRERAAEDGAKALLAKIDAKPDAGNSPEKEGAEV